MSEVEEEQREKISNERQTLTLGYITDCLRIQHDVSIGRALVSPEGNRWCGETGDVHFRTTTCSDIVGKIESRQGLLLWGC